MMNIQVKRKFFSFFLILTTIFISACAFLSDDNSQAPLIVAEQGSFTVDGSIIKNDGRFAPIELTAVGQTLR